MKTVLVSWIGDNDLRAPGTPDEEDIGAVARTLMGRRFERALLLYGYGEERQEQLGEYLSWLKARTRTTIELRHVELEKPTDLSEIYTHVDGILKEVRSGKEELQLAYHISSGSKSMAALWILIGKAIHPGEILESHPQSGVTPIEIPFDFHMEVARKLEMTSAGLVPEGSNFQSIIYGCDAMKRVVQQAQLAAEIPVTVLFEGDSGTGKELFANAIHAESPRASRPFVAVNCGAIPKELIESQLFGHEKGAFTGANKRHQGLFEQADKGTLFLDEVGELPPDAQVKLLRALNDRTIRPVGGNRTVKVDVRIVAATHRKLGQEVAEGRFREDLFYRLAVAVIRLPRLCERENDIELLVRHIMTSQGPDSPLATLFEGKQLDEGAWQVLRHHTWPGNVRELTNTLTRAALWASDNVLTEADVREALFPVELGSNASGVLGHPIVEGFDLNAVLDDVKGHYIERALAMTRHNKTRAAHLLGLKSQQNLTNWMKKCGL